MKFSEILAAFHGVPAVVVGDLMLDRYIFGHATRISPEAPVMVIQQSRTAAVPGGAANVALNLAALGAEVQMFGVVGIDESAEALRDAAWPDHLRLDLTSEADRPTTSKTRIVADQSHQVLRIDHEVSHPISAEVEAEILSKVEAALPSAKVLILSDYLKGTLTPTLVHALVLKANKLGIKVAANPKPESVANFVGLDLLTLNRREATSALGTPDFVATRDADELCQKLGVKSLVVTLGADGMIFAPPLIHVPAIPVEVYDPAGAGDTVIATLALALATVGIGLHALELATQTAAAVVRKVGVATPSTADLASIAAL